MSARPSSPPSRASSPCSVRCTGPRHQRVEPVHQLLHLLLLPNAGHRPRSPALCLGAPLSPAPDVAARIPSAAASLRAGPPATAHQLVAGLRRNVRELLDLLQFHPQLLDGRCRGWSPSAAGLVDNVLHLGLTTWFASPARSRPNASAWASATSSPRDRRAGAAIRFRPSGGGRPAVYWARRGGGGRSAAARRCRHRHPALLRHVAIESPRLRIARIAPQRLHRPAARPHPDCRRPMPAGRAESGSARRPESAVRVSPGWPCRPTAGSSRRPPGLLHQRSQVIVVCRCSCRRRRSRTSFLPPPGPSTRGLDLQRRPCLSTCR